MDAQPVGLWPESDVSGRNDMATGESKEFDPRDLTAQLVEVLRPLMSATAVRRGPRSLEELDGIIKSVPAGIAANIDAARNAIELGLAKEKERRAASFGGTLASFIAASRDRGRTVREAEGWRVDELELRTRPGEACVGFFYNRLQVGIWQGVGSALELERAYRSAVEKLGQHDIPQDVLAETVWEAHSYLAARSHKSNALVQIRDLHRELRAALVRYELRTKPDRPIKGLELPGWAFLHNLDRYRESGASIPAGKRVTFQTGSQADTQRIGVTLNGLRADEEYRTYCYLQASARDGDR